MERISVQQAVRISVNGDNPELDQWLATASAAELEGFISSIWSGHPCAEKADRILRQRYHQRQINPHWTTVPNFVASIIAAITGIAGLVIALVALWRTPALPPPPSVFQPRPPVATSLSAPGGSSPSVTGSPTPMAAPQASAAKTSSTEPSPAAASSSPSYTLPPSGGSTP